MSKYLLLILSVAIFSCNNKKQKTIGTVERIDSAVNSIISENCVVEIIAEGYEWSEGPVWVESEKMLLFSDVPTNIVYKWTEEKGAEEYLKPSGFTGTTSRGGEIGSNGLTLTKDGKLALCQHGDRRVAYMDAPLNAPKPNFITIADNYQGKKFNSPNDLVFRSNGDLFFTDPPYGLEKNEDDPLKELPFQGVYKVRHGHPTILLTDSITRPNGIALTPDEKTLVVANSDPERAIWYAFDFNDQDSIINRRIIYNATSEGKNEKGSPDGFKIDKQGNIFATGPGGIWIFDNSGKVIGKIKIPETTSNCALSPDEKTLYITADMYVLRVKMR